MVGGGGEEWRVVTHLLWQRLGLRGDMVRVKGGGEGGERGGYTPVVAGTGPQGRHGRSERGGEGCLHTCCSRDWASGETWSE